MSTKFDLAFEIPNSTDMVFKGKKTAIRPNPNYASYSDVATDDMYKKNNCIDDDGVNHCEIYYQMADCKAYNPPSSDKADVRRGIYRIDDSWPIKFCKLNGVDLIRENDFVVRPCPPYCSNS